MIDHGKGVFPSYRRGSHSPRRLHDDTYHEAYNLFRRLYWEGLECLNQLESMDHANMQAALDVLSPEGWGRIIRLRACRDCEQGSPISASVWLEQFAECLIEFGKTMGEADKADGHIQNKLNQAACLILAAVTDYDWQNREDHSARELRPKSIDNLLALATGTVPLFEKRLERERVWVSTLIKEDDNGC